MSTLYLTIWLLPAAAFAGLTFIEGESAGGGKWDLWRVAGLVCCLFWPVTLPLLLVFSLRYFRQTSKAARERITRRLGGGSVALLMLLASWLMTMPTARAVQIL